MGAAHGSTSLGCSTCTACSQGDVYGWPGTLASESSAGKKHRAKDMSGKALDQGQTRSNMEELMKELFDLHDLNGDGMLQMHELVKLNEKIALLHRGIVDPREVRATYETLFLTKLDPDGKPVMYPKFRAYVLEMLDGQDKDLEAQEMILEQFVVEAQCGRQVHTQDLVTLREDSASPTMDSIAGEGTPNWCAAYLARPKGKLQESQLPVLMPPSLLDAGWLGLADSKSAGRHNRLSHNGCLWAC
mmetsp:Transcript_36552/g.66274  ORF Transcript_36552/g.66274 Transcript_36552/m.66274 type:complete len:245 (+) Transcript_36552:74-808(+)